MTDAKPWRDNPQPIEGLLSPLEKPVPLGVAAELHLHIEA